MRKTAAAFTVTTLVLGIFGAFFRWLQNTNAFDKATGLPVPAHGTTIVFLIYCVLAVAAVTVLSFVWLRRYAFAKDITALRSATPIPIVLGWILAAGFVLAACVVLFFADFGAYPTIQRIFGAFAILGGVCFPFLIGKPDGSIRSFGRTAAAVAVLFFCFWLIYCYRINSGDPILMNYATEILAVAAAAAAMYYVASFHFGAGYGRRAVFAVQLAVFFNFSTLFDTRSTAMTVMFLCTTGILLILEFLLLENMKQTAEN